MQQVAPHSMRQFSGGLLMPNTGIPGICSNIFSEKEIRWYAHQVQEVTQGSEFLSLLTYFLSPDLKDSDLQFATSDFFREGNIAFGGIKYYPKGGTTNSDKGMNGFSEVSHILEKMEKYQISLLIHGEVALDRQGIVIDDFDREEVFYQEEMEALRKRFPELPLVMEHITTRDAAEFVMRYPEHTRATITPQHLLFDRRALFNGTSIQDTSFFYNTSQNGMNPSQMCRPILKSQQHVMALREHLMRQYEYGGDNFGLGTDSAPHLKEKKYCECGACGVYSAPLALELYAMAFDEMNLLDHLQEFAGGVMPRFYGITERLPHKEVVLTLTPQGTKVEPHYDGIVTPFAGQVIPWELNVKS
jgi:dihydroorotase